MEIDGIADDYPKLQFLGEEIKIGYGFFLLSLKEAAWEIIVEAFNSHCFKKSSELDTMQTDIGWLETAFSIDSSLYVVIKGS